MKKVILTLMLCAASVLSLMSCASNCVAYEKGAEEYAAVPVSEKVFRRSLYVDDYEMRFKALDKKVQTITVFGIGGRQGTVSQSGILWRNSQEVSKVLLYRELKGSVFETESFSAKSTVTEDSMTVYYGENAVTLKLKDIDEGPHIIKTDVPFELEADWIKQVQAENGKVADLPFYSFAGAEVSAGGEVYCIIDCYNSCLRMNTEYGVELSQKDKDFLNAAVLGLYQYLRNFYSED